MRAALRTHRPANGGGGRQIRGILAYGIGPVLGILSGPVLARSLGPAGRGQLAAVMQPVTVAGAIASLGIPAAVTYFVARSYHPGQTYRRALVLTVAPALLVYLAMAYYSSAVSAAQQIDRSVLFIAWSAVVLSAVVQIRRSLLQGQSNWGLLDAERASFAVLRFLAVVVVAFVGAQTAAPYAYLSLLAFVIAALLLWKPTSVVPSADGVSGAGYKQIRNYSLAASIGTITTVANSRLDQVLFPAAGSNVELGYYAVAVTVAEVPMVLGVLAARDLLTMASHGQTIRAMLRSVRLYLLGAVVGCAVLSAGSFVAVPLVFGDDFEPAGPSVVILCIGTSFAVVAVAIVSILSGWGRPGISSAVPVIGLVVTVVGFYTRWGIVTSVDAAVIATASQASACLVGIGLVLWIRTRGRR